MFAMLNGPWPVAADASYDAAAVERRVAEAVRAQVDAGMDLVTDGLVRWRDPAGTLAAALAAGDTGAGGLLVRAWLATAAVPGAEAATVAAVVTGPCTLAARAGASGPATWFADRLAVELAALEDAGCPLVVIDEPAAVAVGADPGRREAFRTAHGALLAEVTDLHVMLAITGGSAWGAGAETILEAPYRSYLVDLVAGPDNWHLVRAAAGERGIVCAALIAPSIEDQAPALVWAARYAASGNGRGPDRVGLANGSSLGELDAEGAARALEALARGARLAGLEPRAAIAEGLDPQTYAGGRGRGAR